MTSQSATDFFLPTDLVARALASLAEQEHDAIDKLSAQPEQGDPTVKEELSFHLRDYNAFIKAAHQWAIGVRPVATPRGWIVPSRTTGGVVYEVCRADGYWRCGPNCQARQFHWHTALVLGIERAMEMADEEDDGDNESHDAYEAYEPDVAIETDPHLPGAAAQLGRRLADARAMMMEQWAA